MKATVSIAAILLLLANAALLAPQLSGHTRELAIASLALALVVLAATLASRRRPSQPASQPSAATTELKPAASASQQDQVRAELVTLLGLFQQKGRLVDFLMEDISPYSDAEVGSVARSVHDGCKAALAEHFTIEPVAAQAEGSEISVPAGYSASEYRLVGNLSGQAPFRGTLVHKGWKVRSVRLPQVLASPDQRHSAIAPAQVEVK